MKKTCLLLVGLLALPAVPARAADDWVRYTAQPAGSQVRVEGTSTIHDWSVETKLIGGYIEFDPLLNLDHPSPGKVNARVAVSVRILLSIFGLLAKSSTGLNRKWSAIERLE